MGFTSGFLGGVALTSTALYLSVAIHRQNRIHQSTLLRQQDSVLRNILEPAPPAPPPVTREVRAGLVERAKDIWNAEVEALVRTVNDTDWSAVRERWERRLERTVESVGSKVSESLPSKLPTKSELVAPAVRREG